MSAPLPGRRAAIERAIVAAAGPVAERGLAGLTRDQIVATHESGHAVANFLFGFRFREVSIVRIDGHSEGHCGPRVSADTPRWPKDGEQVNAFADLAGSNPIEVEEEASLVLATHWPMVRRLAAVLVERKQLTGRQARRILIRARRKDLRRALAVMERHRREREGMR